MIEYRPVTRLYYWIHHTGSYDGNTGVQRVVRALATALSINPQRELMPVRWCAEREAIVRADGPWLKGLSCFGGPALRLPPESGEPLHLTVSDRDRLSGSWLLLPEVPHVGGGSSELSPSLPIVLDYARYYGLRTAAIFYDLIPLRTPGYESMAEAHARYASALATFDLVLPISKTASGDLTSWWRETHHASERIPAPLPLLLSAETAGVPRVSTTRPTGKKSTLRVVAFGTVEPRKNQITLIRAVNRLRARRLDLDIQLDVVGHLHPAVAHAITSEVNRSAGFIRLHPYMPDHELVDLITRSDVTAFLSLAEGFGLPIMESLWLGRACLCSDVGSMAEIAAGGGCLAVDPTDQTKVEMALEQLAQDPVLRDQLEHEALRRPLVDWSSYARGVVEALENTPPLPVVCVVESTDVDVVDTIAAIESFRTRVHAFRWRSDTSALIPGLRARSIPAPAIGLGQLQGLWGLLPLSTASSPAEVMQIQDEARGLGLRLAIVLESGRDIGQAELLMIGEADLVVVSTQAERDTLLAAAFRSLSRVSTLRNRVRVASDTLTLLRLLAGDRSRIVAAMERRHPARIFLSVGATASVTFNTGIQRVARMLGRKLEEIGVEVHPLTWDEATNTFRSLDDREAANLALWGGPRAKPPTQLPSLDGEWLLIADITVPMHHRGTNIADLGRALGMRVASIFYDLLPLRTADIYPSHMVESFRTNWPNYWSQFGRSDVVLPISWSVAGQLRRYLADCGTTIPVIVPCPLAGDLPGAERRFEPRGPLANDAPLRLLCIGTLEPRKNYSRVIRGVMDARQRTCGRAIHLTIVGRWEREFSVFLEEVTDLARAAGNVEFCEHLSDEEVVALCASSDATIFASWDEGFGLPVLESLWRGLPCICHEGSSLAEVAPGGGTLSIDMLDESAIANAIVRLGTETDLLPRLSSEATLRPIRSWDTYARDVLSAISRVATPPGWPRFSVSSGTSRPLLSCAVTTYNRAHWLRHTLPRLVEAARPFGRSVEVVVCDNTSTDGTTEVISRYKSSPNFISRRNPVNVGMLGNLGATARATNGEFVWLLGDDDLVLEGAIEAIVEGIERHSDVEMAYLNYAYTGFDDPEQMSDTDEIVRTARSIGYGGPNRRVATVSEVAALNENLFTAIYACVFRRDHALRAYQQDTSGPPFSSLLTCVPSSVYALAALQDRPAYWVGQPALVVNMNVSWLRWVLLWHLERMPDLFDAAEFAHVDRTRVDRHRIKHCWDAAAWAREALLESDPSIRNGFSVARLIERCKHLGQFQREIPGLRKAYETAWARGQVGEDQLAPRELFDRYGY